MPSRSIIRNVCIKGEKRAPQIYYWDPNKLILIRCAELAEVALCNRLRLDINRMCEWRVDLIGALTRWGSMCKHNLKGGFVSREKKTTTESKGLALML